MGEGGERGSVLAWGKRGGPTSGSLEEKSNHVWEGRRKKDLLVSAAVEQEDEAEHAASVPLSK